jgi:hypothetical protein
MGKSNIILLQSHLDGTINDFDMAADRAARENGVKWMRFGKRTPQGKWMRFGKVQIYIVITWLEFSKDKLISVYYFYLIIKYKFANNFIKKINCKY